MRANIYSNLFDKYFGFAITPDILIDATYYGNNTRLINHNIPEESNLEIIRIFVQGKLKLMFKSKRNIQKNEELTFDYLDKFSVDWKK